MQLLSVCNFIIPWKEIPYIWAVTSILSCSFSSAPGHHSSTFYLYGFAYFHHFTWRKSHSMCFFVTGVLWLISVIYFFLLHNNIPYMRFCFSVQQLMNICDVSTSLLVWITLLWTFVYRYLCGHMFSVFLGYIHRSELLGCMVTIFDIFRNCQIFYHDVCTCLHSQQQSMKVPVLLHLLQHLLSSWF